MTLERKLTSNTAYVFLSGIVTRLFSFVFVVYAARVLGPSDFGLYSLIVTLTFFYAFWGNFGVNNVAIREIAKDRSGAETVFNAVLTLKMLLVVVAYPALVLASYLLGYSEHFRYLIYISGITTIFSVFSGSFGIIYMSFERFKFPSYIAILVSLLQNLASIIVLYIGYGLDGVVWVSFWAALIGAIISGVWIRKKIIKYRLVFALPLFKELMGQSLPFAIVTFFQQTTTYLNNMLLSQLPGPLPGKTAVGYYNLPSSICRNAMLLPESFRQAAFPTVAANAGNLKAVEGIIDRSTKSFLAIIIFPLIIVTNIFPKDIVTLFFGVDYLPCVPALMVLGWAYALQVFNAPVSIALAASREIKQFVPWAALVFTINVGLAVPLVIYYGFTGAAWAFLVSKICETFVRHYLLQKIWGISNPPSKLLLSRIFQLIAASLALLAVGKALVLPSSALLALTLLLYTGCTFLSQDFRQGVAVIVRGIRGMNIEGEKFDAAK